MRKAQRLQEAARLERARTAEQAHNVDNKAKQDFFDAARDLGLWKHKQFKEGELSVSFNDAAEFVEGADKGGDDDENFAPDWEDTADDDGADSARAIARGAGRVTGIGEIKEIRKRFEQTTDVLHKISIIFSL